MGTQKIVCKIYKEVKNSPARRLYITAYKVLYGLPNNRKIDFTEFDEGTKYIVASIEDKPVGIIAYIKERDEDITYVNMVYTLTRYRKKGIMRSMFKHLLRRNKILEWNAASSAIPAYEKIGAKRKKRDGLSFTMEKFDFINKK